MLLNLSNHPSTYWSQAQIDEACRLYDFIDDLEFPYIDPYWSYEEVAALAIQFSDDIEKEKPSAVHLMGELTFCFILARLLKDSGISCIASTTQRVVVEEDEKKISTFKFVQFRPYFKL